MKLKNISNLGVLALLSLSSYHLCAKSTHQPKKLPNNKKHVVKIQTEADIRLQEIIIQQNLTASIPDLSNLPRLNHPVSQLGMKLFFSKALGGEKTVACASCHHPRIGGADGLSFPIGTNAVDPDIIGPLRLTSETINIPRNSPTIFNVGLSNSSLFWDGRVERFTITDSQGNEQEVISTPDSGFGVPDLDVGNDLVGALSRFPVTSVEEMRGAAFENAFNNQSVREHLAERLGNYGSGNGDLEKNNWLNEFRRAFNSTDNAESLITFDSIALALGQYQSSVNLINSPWSAYLKGDFNALSQAQKRGANLFFSQISDGGAGCVNCHGGTRFSNDGFFNLAFPQFGIGTGDQNIDHGRFDIDPQQRNMFAFKVPSLLNVELTGPYGHSGAYETLEEVVAHYVNPADAINNFFSKGGACGLSQFKNDASCEILNNNAQNNSLQALALLQLSPFVAPPLDVSQQDDLVQFLKALTDKCAKDHRCVRKFEPSKLSQDPDELRLNLQMIIRGKA
ncbi:cytochrome-c peroxidase [Pseudoalteromonas luteoviolacea]|uniref:cytochrome-c peroxidase n=1 Tax=Pseudoalteromonas luteoviolacea TaxID=43657 RepID=UPI001B3A76B8|nr:cytochrome c peroxidase [Pseudoalteromonas luteoviolacea]MBQ4877831.1 cytochrome-c peroxidase [Pseudoalteromonas luteoviolacea]MBQ4906866.1 cytochrome-c peroxidase [Pseudoalteromonas luteoviolacea]